MHKSIISVGRAREDVRRSAKSSFGAGFTLIELLVVVAIIGLLASIVFASLGSARRNGRIAAAQGTMRNITTSLILCWDNDPSKTTVPTESQDGGGGQVCEDKSITTTKYGALPSGWVFCLGGQTCGAADTSTKNPIKLISKSISDNKEITCDEGGCVTKNAD